MRRRSNRSFAAVLVALLALGSLALDTGSAAAAATGHAAAGHRAVAAPRFVRNIATGETGWFSADLLDETQPQTTVQGSTGSILTPPEEVHRPA